MDSTKTADDMDDSAPQDSLEQFREKWQNELNSTKTNALPNDQNDDASSEFSSEVCIHIARCQIIS